MEHEAHIRLVDAHAEGNRGADDDALLGHEQALRFRAIIGRHAGVIGDGAETLGDEEGGPFLGRLARQRIDDAGLTGTAIEKVDKLLLGIVLGRHRQAQVGPVETRDIDLRLPAEDLAHDIAPGRLVRRRRKGADGNTGEGLPQGLQHVVLRSERSAPLRDAMRLVDGDQGHVETRQCPHHALGHQPLGRQIEQAHLATRDPPPDGDVLVAVLCGVDAFGGHPGELECRHLVLHQRHQRRDDDGQPAARQSRHLVAQRLPRPGGHDGQHIAPIEKCGDDTLLAGPEALVAEGLAENVVRFHAGTSSGSAPIRGPLIDYPASA